MSVDRRTALVIWISILSQNYAPCNGKNTGIDIGDSCKYDWECVAGNGGQYSKCNQDLSICICTITHYGEDKCRHDSDKYANVCRPDVLSIVPRHCTLECSPKGTIKWPENRDWYGDIVEPFATFIHDKKTVVCYDPVRAFNSIPDEFEIKVSTIPGAGLGTFTKTYIEQDTILGPYKGILEPDTDTATESGYSWKIDTRKGEDRAGILWVDAKYVALSNWLRYSNTPVTAEMENLFAIQYKGEIYYQVFRTVQPGTELLVWYGEIYGEFLKIKSFQPPTYYYGKPGYVGGSCHEDDERLSCEHDDNTLCVDKTCFCASGAHARGGMCIYDGMLGGMCAGLDGDTCVYDTNAECQRGVCVCKNNTTPANGLCLLDERFGGRCNHENGHTCLVDNNAECVHGVCRCKYGSTGIRGQCIKDERHQGRCAGDDGEVCDHDHNAECLDGICVCKQNASAINGICAFDEMIDGRCNDSDGTQCRLDTNAICIGGICRCKFGASHINGTCRIDGDIQGMCIKGKCLVENAACDSTSNICNCETTHVPHAGKCVEK